jgi:hypothetical protein
MAELEEQQEIVRDLEHAADQQGSAWNEASKSAPAGDGEDQQHPGALASANAGPGAVIRPVAPIRSRR